MFNKNVLLSAIKENIKYDKYHNLTDNRYNYDTNNLNLLRSFLSEKIFYLELFLENDGVLEIPKSLSSKIPFRFLNKDEVNANNKNYLYVDKNNVKEMEVENYLVNNHFYYPVINLSFKEILGNLDVWEYSQRQIVFLNDYFLVEKVFKERSDHVFNNPYKIITSTVRQEKHLFFDLLVNHKDRLYNFDIINRRGDKIGKINDILNNFYHFVLAHSKSIDFEDGFVSFLNKIKDKDKYSFIKEEDKEDLVLEFLDRGNKEIFALFDLHVSKNLSFKKENYERIEEMFYKKYSKETDKHNFSILKNSKNEIIKNYEKINPFTIKQSDNGINKFYDFSVWDLCRRTVDARLITLNKYLFNSDLFTVQIIKKEFSFMFSKEHNLYKMINEDKIKSLFESMKELFMDASLFEKEKINVNKASTALDALFREFTLSLKFENGNEEKNKLIIRKKI